ncbi:hypothetical protein HDV00_009132 [Rhizophlyctis rosea]|nr:hypothetical protein HDV00_009132 [Rhizophlyctis rosea]
MDKSLDDIIKERKHQHQPAPRRGGPPARGGGIAGRLGGVAGGKIGKRSRHVPYQKPLPPRNMNGQWKHDMYQGPPGSRPQPHHPFQTPTYSQHDDLRGRLTAQRQVVSDGPQTRTIITTMNPDAVPTTQLRGGVTVGGLVSDRMALTDRLGPQSVVAAPAPAALPRSRLVEQQLASAGVVTPQHVVNGFANGSANVSRNGAANGSALSIRGNAGTIVEIANLHPEASVADLKETFAEFGTILDVDLAVDAQGVSTGVARIKFESRGPALTAIKKYDGKMADGKILKVVEIPQGVSIAGIARSAAPLAAASPAPVARAPSGAMYSDRMEVQGRLGPRAGPESMAMDMDVDMGGGRGGGGGGVLSRVGAGRTTFNVRF